MNNKLNKPNNDVLDDMDKISVEEKERVKKTGQLLLALQWITTVWAFTATSLIDYKKTSYMLSENLLVDVPTFANYLLRLTIIYPLAQSEILRMRYRLLISVLLVWISISSTYDDQQARYIEKAAQELREAEEREARVLRERPSGRMIIGQDALPGMRTFDRETWVESEESLLPPETIREINEVKLELK